jgi:hypothetical protein
MLDPINANADFMKPPRTGGPNLTGAAMREFVSRGGRRDVGQHPKIGGVRINIDATTWRAAQGALRSRPLPARSARKRGEAKPAPLHGSLPCRRIEQGDRK